MGSVKHLKRALEGGNDIGTTVHGKSQEAVMRTVLACKTVLEAHSSKSSEEISDAISQLGHLGQLSTTVLKETEIGRLVNQVSKLVACNLVRDSLKTLLAEWKRLHKSAPKAARIDAEERDCVVRPEIIPQNSQSDPQPSAGDEPLSLEIYRKRLGDQQKYYDHKPGTRSVDNCLQDPPTMPPTVTIHPKLQPVPERSADGHFLFPDFLEFKPNLSPKQIVQAGSFGGTYYRDIVSAVTGIRYKGKEVITEFPGDWFEGLCLEDKVLSPDYSKTANRYGVACGGSMGMWETSGWISAIDPYGWFQWYCRFFLGRRSSDDARQVDRWLKGQGPKGRWRIQLMNKIVKSRAKFDDSKVSPVIRQVLLHWGYELSSADLEAYINK